MTVDEGCDFFENIQSIRSKLITLKHVGLGYMKKLVTSYNFIWRRSPKNKTSQRTIKTSYWSNIVYFG